MFYILIIIAVLEGTLSMDMKSTDDIDSLFGVTARSKFKNFTTLAEYDGYKTETHFVTTDDGYIIQIFRVPPKVDCVNTHNITETILFQHGLLTSADDCIIPGPGRAHCYIYADECHDVWAPNSRGNKYSRNHIRYNPDKDFEFWDFTYEDMALKDMPPVIDYILNQTNKRKLVFVGHSQGVAVQIILCALKAEYNEIFKIGFGLAPATWQYFTLFPVSLVQTFILSPFVTPANNAGFNIEIFPHGGITQGLADIFCTNTKLTSPICYSVIFALFGYDKFQISDDILPVVLSLQPSGTSLKNFNKFAQVRKNGFSRNDFGAIQNILNYGSIKPPLYDLSNVTMKWIFFESETDTTTDLKDLDILLAHLSNSEHQTCVVPKFMHLDFVYGKNLREKISSVVLKYLYSNSVDCYKP